MYIDAKYKLDIRDWKETGHKLSEKINKACKNFTIMHYNEIIMTTEQHKDLGELYGFLDTEDKKAKLYNTDQGFIMEVKVDDN